VLIEVRYGASVRVTREGWYAHQSGTPLRDVLVREHTQPEKIRRPKRIGFLGKTFIAAPSLKRIPHREVHRTICFKHPGCSPSGYAYRAA